MNPALEREHEQPGKLASGVLAVLVHLIFFAFLFFGVSWQRRPPEPVVADLWSSLPPVAKPQPKLEVVPPPPAPPVVKPEPVPPKPEPKVEVKPAPEPKPTVKPEIALEKEKQDKAKREQKEKAEQAEQKKREEAREKAEIAKREAIEKQKLAALERERSAKEDLRAKLEKEQAESVKKFEQQAAAQAAAQAKELEAFKSQIARKVRSRLVSSACAGLGDPEVVVDIVALPGGQIRDAPSIRKSSGAAACDEAVRRALVAADPLPLPPPGHPLLAQFRNFTFNFYPMRD